MFYVGYEGDTIRLHKENTVETVVLMGRKNEDLEYVYVPCEASKDLVLTGKASYGEIKAWILQEYGFNVTSLMVAQTK